MKYIIILVPAWGHENGGINSFNHEFAIALGQATLATPYTTICISTKPLEVDAVASAAESNFRVLSLRSTNEKYGTAEWAQLKRIVAGLDDPELIYCIGHDRFTGPAAVEFHNITGTKGKSFVFHHMNYEAYSNIKDAMELSVNEEKFVGQRDVLNKADIVLPVGPKLFDSARNKVGAAKPVYEILPGIEQIDPVPLGNVFSAIVFGRYDVNNDRLKQMLLGATAFARFVNADGNLRGDATFDIVGVSDTEEVDVLKARATAGLRGYFNINGHRYTQDRQFLFGLLASRSVCLMLSVHEGFGLVGFEAIAAGVPLIVSVNTGLHQFLTGYLSGEKLSDYGVFAVDAVGSMDGSTDKEDLRNVIEAFEKVAADLPAYKQGVARLREKLLKSHLWAHSAASFLAVLEKVQMTLDNGAEVDKREMVVETAIKLNALGKPQPLLDNGLQSSGNYLAFSARTVGMIGGERNLAGLKAFMDDESLFEWWTVVGDGGSGKSRLALELAIHYIDHEGWYAGFMDVGDIASFNWSAWRPVLDTLIIVDGASVDPAALKRVLALFKLLKDGWGNKVRVLLLERHQHMGWWQILQNAIQRTEIRGQYQQQALELKGLSDHELVDLISSFKAKIGLDAPNSEILSRLKSSKNYQLPLHALMGMSNMKLLGQLSTNDIFEDHYNFQQEQVWQACFGDKRESDRNKTLVAFFNFIGGITEEELKELIGKGCVFFPAEISSKLLAALNLRGQGKILPMLPDLVSEYFVHRTWIEPADSLDVPSGFAEMIALAWSRNPKAVADFLRRYLHDFPKGRVDMMIPRMDAEPTEEYFDAWYNLKVEVLVTRISEQGFSDGTILHGYNEIVKGISLAGKTEEYKAGLLKSILEGSSLLGLDLPAKRYLEEFSMLLEQSQDVPTVLKGSYAFYRMAKRAVEHLKLDLFDEYREELVKIETYDQTIASAQLLEKLDADAEFYKTYLSSLEDARTFDLSHPAGTNPDGVEGELKEAEILRLLVSDSLAKDNFELAKGYLSRISGIADVHPGEGIELILLKTTIQLMEYCIVLDIEDESLLDELRSIAFRGNNPILIEEWASFWERKFSHLIKKRPALAAQVLVQMEQVFAVDGLRKRVYNLFWMCNTHLLAHYLDNLELSKAAECYGRIKKMDDLDPSHQDDVSRCQAALKMWAYFKKYGEESEAQSYYDEAKAITGIGEFQFKMIKMYADLDLTLLDGDEGIS